MWLNLLESLPFQELILLAEVFLICNKFSGPVRSTCSPISCHAFTPVYIHGTERQWVGILRAALEVEYLTYISQPILPTVSVRAVFPF